MKVVLKLDMDGDKQKQKAMEAVSTLHGIDSIAVDMRVQEMTVVGSVDPADVLKKLRNSFPATDIISVGPAKEEKKMDAIKTQDSHPPLPRGSGDHPHLVTAELPVPRKTVEIPAGEKKAINSELWHACAGPLVSMPPVGSLVVYFPQGHSEQVAASMHKEVDIIPNYPSLPSKLICKLLSLTLHADSETDEVYAQMTLQPVSKYDRDAMLASELGLKQNKQPVEFFCKTLTASDTSTHGGFSVLRRAAEKIFPPLDFTMQPPAQELMAKDLHDISWKFRHIFRGQPKRHLLTTGWSVFVSTKRLLAGDSVLFIRDEKSQLLLGIRRSTRPQPALSSSVLSSDSMHIGILDAAAHAAANSSPFTIFYNPRASPSEFVIPLAKYNKALYTQVSLGMRFRMLFETEDSGVRRYMGTITGIGDLDPVRWKNSHWRNLQVGWDESTASERRTRVSIWEIEPVAMPFYICPPPFFRPKLPKQPEMPERYTEAPVCALVGVMYRLPAKLDGLLRHGHMLPKGADGEIPLIKQDLGVMTAVLHDYSNSGAENRTMMIECLMKEVRELSYDIEDCIDQYEHAANSRSLSGFRIPRRKNKITHRNSKTTRLPEKLKRRLWMANKIREFSLRSQQALQRCNVFDLGGTSTASARCDASFGSWHPTQYGEHADQPVGLDVPMNTLEEWLTKDGEQTLKVASIVGVGGVGKTTLASELYSRTEGQFECRAFVRTSQKPDIKRLLISMLSQVRPNHQPDNWKVHSLITDIRTHLQDKRYLIVIDDVWATSTWDIVNCVLLDGNCCSRILITTEIEDVALKCCGYDSKYVFMMKPLGDDDASKLFFNTAFGPQHQCPPELGEVSKSIIRKCGGLPLATVTIASLLASRMGKLEQWDYINKSLGYGLRTNPTFEGMKLVLNLSYNNLPQHLKPCMLYLSIYQEDQIISKDDLVKQWIAESFICATEEKDEEEISRSYFDELIRSRMIQPVHMNDNNEVLSCTVHCMVLNFIAQKSIEDNIVTAIDHSQTSTRLADKVRRLSLHFGNAEDATTPTNMRLSQVRTLAFFGVFKCVPSIVEFPLLQVLILHLWGDEQSISFDLSRISELFRLRYLQVICNVTLELQTQMRGLQYLETLKIDARVSTVPSNIVHLPALLHLSLPVETNLPNGIGRMASLRTLGYFDLSSNSIDNVLSIGELTNLQDLQLTCSTVPSDYLESKMIIMGLILAKLGNLKSLTLEPSSILDAGPSSRSISCDVWSSISSPPALLQRLEWLPHVCTFSSLPKWIGHLSKLCILKFGIRELARNDVDLLRGLPALTVLSLYVHTMPAERIIFHKGGFLVLKHFEFRCSVPCLQFEADSMPNLRKLKLGFDAHGADQHGTVPVGLEHLSGLKEICAKIGGAGANEPGRRSAKSALIDAMRMHLGRPTVNIQSVDRMFGGKDDQISLFFDRLNRGNRGSSSCPRRQGRELSPKVCIERCSVEDGRSWRKYGQKDILGAKYPRCYYRCERRFKHTCVPSTHWLPHPAQEQSSISDASGAAGSSSLGCVSASSMSVVTSESQVTHDAVSGSSAGVWSALDEDSIALEKMRQTLEEP